MMFLLQVVLFLFFHDISLNKFVSKIVKKLVEKSLKIENMKMQSTKINMLSKVQL
jgi:nitrogen fixation/metabolism regulation signal transduction histidine kinase